MRTEAETLQRIISASVRDMLDAYRIQASPDPVTDKAIVDRFYTPDSGPPSMGPTF